MNETACERFEIAIEMRRHGAANPEASGRLDEHLRDCARCRAYAALGAETDTRLRADAEEAIENTDLERLRARGYRLLREAWTDYGAFFLLGSIASAVRVALEATGMMQGDVSVDAAQAILFFVLPFAYLRRSRREIDEAWNSETLFYALRTDVTFRLKVSVFLGMLCTGGAALSSVLVQVPDHGLIYGIARALLLACFGALGFVVLAVRVPQLLRERREIPFVADPYQHSSESFFGLW